MAAQAQPYQLLDGMLVGVETSKASYDGGVYRV
jgi:hypothetical protein